MQGGLKPAGLWPRGPPLCARSPPYVLSYVLLLVQMAGGGPLMRAIYSTGREMQREAPRKIRLLGLPAPISGEQQPFEGQMHAGAAASSFEVASFACVLAGWFLQERKEREANEQQQREAPRKIPRCVSCVTSISGRTTSKQSTTSAKRNMTSCLDRMTSSKQSTTSSKPSTTS